MSSTSLGPESSSYTVGPTLPAEITKPPFRPGVAGRIGFFFGPIAGAFVASVNLQRMGQPDKASRVRSYTLLVAIVVGIILILLPSGLGHILGIGMEVASLTIFPRIQDKSFADWQRVNSGAEPSSGWSAIGWGFLGLILYAGIIFLIVMAMVLMKIPIPD
ncbi:MAG TPA: hypothetical protein VLK33_21725 [Terriglobales bacterium]|nr:hypothetical protein [Terriglobales bacterium]